MLTRCILVVLLGSLPLGATFSDAQSQPEPKPKLPDVELTPKGFIFRGPPNELTYSRKFHDNKTLNCISDVLTLEYKDGNLKISSKVGETLFVNSKNGVMNLAIGSTNCQISIVISKIEQSTSPKFDRINLAD